MILYHGSTLAVETPEIRVSEVYLDFGNGFYTTTSYEQAERWARIKMRRAAADKGYISAYEFDFEAAFRGTEIRRFTNADRDWLDFVVANRRGENTHCTADMIIGPVADDNVYRSIRLFEIGVLSAEETLNRLKTEILQDQWAFHTEKALSYLSFTGSKEIKSGE